MKRREFLQTSAGLLAVAIAPGIWSCQRPRENAKSYDFLPADKGKAAVPVVKVTPDDGLFVHTYFDVTPFSPSQRYMAVTRLPFQDRMPVLGDIADVCIIDLENHTIRTVYSTKCFGYQTGANVQWGATDKTVYTNDVIDGRAVSVRIDLESGEATAFEGPMYSISPDESCVVGFTLEYLDITQLGYGVPPKDYDHLAALPPGASKTEGIWRTDLKTGKKSLLVSLADAAAAMPEAPPRPDYTFYFWHSKFNKQGTRIYQVLRCLFSDGWNGRNPVNLTFNADGSNIKYATPWYHQIWGSGGGHPNWHPDGEHLIRHLKMDDGKDYFIQFKYDGSSYDILSDKITGGGHPSIEPTGRYLITDSFKKTSDSKTVSLRFIDLKAGKEEIACTLPTIRWEDKFDDNVYRLDGHPSWSRDYKKVSLQAAHEGKRQLFMVDVSGLMV